MAGQPPYPAQPYGYPQQGYPPPGYVPQWGPPQPPRRKSNAGWIIGGVAVVVVLLAVAVVGGVLVLRSTSEEEPTANPTATATPPGGGTEPGGTYAAREDICTAVDISPAEEFAPNTDSRADQGDEFLGLWFWQCAYDIHGGPGGDHGYLRITVDVHPDAQEAKRNYDTYAAVGNEYLGQQEPAAEGPWQEGVTYIDDESDESGFFLAVQNNVLDGNLQVEVAFDFSTDPGVDLEADMRAAVNQVTINAMEAMAG